MTKAQQRVLIQLREPDTYLVFGASVNVTRITTITGGDWRHAHACDQRWATLATTTPSVFYALASQLAENARTPGYVVYKLKGD